MNRLCDVVILFLTVLSLAGGAVADKPATVWRDASLRPVSTVAGRHTMHTYYLVNPESPDGSQVVFFAATDRAGHVGNVVVQDRKTGEETVIAHDVHTEDAHRVALQQWLAGGRLVAWHEVVGGRWQVCVFDVVSKEKRVVTRDRQLGFAQGVGDLLPMYGCHWNPGEFRDLYLWNAATGDVSTPVKISDVEKQYAAWLSQEFPGKPVSIAFPTLSPDLNRVFFKLAAGNGGDVFMSKQASHRQGIVCGDLRTGQLLWQRDRWGHPAWHPDSRSILEAGNIVFDTDGGPPVRISNVPMLRGMHPSVSPDGTLWVTDGSASKVGGSEGQWAIMVADFDGQSFEVIDRFKTMPGAASWRGSHPHPVFSADGQRIYFNKSNGEFTQLFVAERRDADE